MAAAARGGATLARHEPAPEAFRAVDEVLIHDEVARALTVSDDQVNDAHVKYAVGSRAT